MSKTKIRYSIKCILMKVIVLVLWIMGAVCILMDTSTWVSAVILFISVICMIYSIYEDIIVLKIDIEMLQDNR